MNVRSGIIAVLSALLLLPSAFARAGDLWAGDPWPSSEAELGPIKWTGLTFSPYFGYESLKLTGQGHDGLKDPKGWRLGAELGYDYQVGNLVIGAAAEGYGTWYKGGGSGAADGFQSRLSDYGTVRGRLGFVYDRFMFYGIGGYAFGELGVKAPQASSYESQMLNGWTAGAGVDWAYQKNLFVRFEVDHIALGETTFNSLPAGAQNLGANLDLFKITFISRF